MGDIITKFKEFIEKIIAAIKSLVASWRQYNDENT